MDDDEYKDFQEVLVSRPDRSSLIKYSGGLRKVLWALEGRGKSGGARVIYYWMTDYDQLYMLLAYPKNVQDNLTDTQLKALKKIVERWSE